MLSGLSTENVAWYGAIVATAVFAFDIWKWARRRARLRVRITKNVFYDDGGFSKVEQTPHGEVKTGIPYYHIEIANIGELPTTILGVSATTREGITDKLRKDRFTFKGVMGVMGGEGTFKSHYGKNLPHVLSAGEVWSCRVPDDRIMGLCQAGHPKLEVAASCWRRPRLVSFPLKDSPARLS